MADLLQLPQTPRGRSRFSKLLPVPPPSPGYVKSRTPTAPSSKLPPLPIMATNAVNRKPVGSTQPTHAPSVSMNSVTSIYSDSPGFANTSSNSSPTRNSPNSAQSTPRLPPSPLAKEAPDVPSKHTDPVEQRQQQQSPPPKASEVGTSIPVGSTREGFTPSPPRPEIWRRRSHSSGKAVAFPELQLDRSNGSTTSPPRKALPAVPPQPEPSRRPSLPRSKSGSTARKPLPVSRKDEPIAHRNPPAPPTQATDGMAVMGNKISKFGDKFKGIREKFDPKKDKSLPPVQPNSGRLPTPEYQGYEKQQPPIPHVLSPSSPRTPPIDTTPPQIPSRSESRSVSSDGTTIVPSTPQQSTLGVKPSEPLTITSTTTMRSPQPRKALPPPLLTPVLSPSLASPTSQPSSTIPSPPVQSPTAQFYGVPILSPSSSTVRSPLSPRQVRFPTLPKPAPPGTVLPGLPLRQEHFQCYTQHQDMRRGANNICPVACMVCGKADKESRWRCTWCCVSACGGCMQVLNKTENNDLQKVVQKVRR